VGEVEGDGDSGGVEAVVVRTWDLASQARGERYCKVYCISYLDFSAYLHYWNCVPAN